MWHTLQYFCGTGWLWPLLRVLRDEWKIARVRARARVCVRARESESHSRVCVLASSAYSNRIRCYREKGGHICCSHGSTGRWFTVYWQTARCTALSQLNRPAVRFYRHRLFVSILCFRFLSFCSAGRCLSVLLDSVFLVSLRFCFCLWLVLRVSAGGM